MVGLTVVQTYTQVEVGSPDRISPPAATQRAVLSSLAGVMSPPRVVLEIVRLFDYRLDIEDRGSVDCFDWAY